MTSVFPDFSPSEDMRLTAARTPLPRDPSVPIHRDLERLSQEQQGAWAQVTGGACYAGLSLDV